MDEVGVRLPVGPPSVKTAIVAGAGISHYMSNTTDNKCMAFSAVTRAKTTLIFLKDSSEAPLWNETDAARSFFLLSSYALELLLNAVAILASDETTETGLRVHLRPQLKNSHNYEQLFTTMPNELKRIGITNIQRQFRDKDGNVKRYTEKDRDSNFVEYVFTLTSGSQITVQDLIDIRYDFMKEVDVRKGLPVKQQLIETVDALLAVARDITSVYQLGGRCRRHRAMLDN